MNLFPFLLHRCAFRFPGGRLVICTLAAVLFALVAGAKTTSSTNNGAWFQPALPPRTWDNGIPAPGDTVNITNDVSITTNAGVVLNVGILNLKPSGFLSLGNPALVINGSSVWSAGAFSGSLVQAGTLTLDSTNKIAIGALTNVGMIFHKNVGGLQMNNGSLLRNTASAVYDFQSDAGISSFACCSTPFFENDGLVRKSGGSGESRVAVPFNNLGGTIDVQTGRLTLAGGGTSTNGTFNVSAGTVLDLTGGGFYSGMFTGSGAGQVHLNGGLIFIYSPCSFNFPSNLFQWDGTINGYTLTNLGTLTLPGTGFGSLGCTLVNLGQVLETGTGSVQFGSGADFQNASGGLYDFQSDAGIILAGGSSFANSGLVRKSGGSGVSSVGVQFTNTGTVEVRSGTLSFSSTVQSGSFTQTAGTTSLNGGALASSFGLNLQGGSLTGSGQITNRVTSSGVVSPGLPVGVLQINNGDYNQTAAGALNIELAGRNPGQFDQLIVTRNSPNPMNGGNARLDGALNLSLLSGFAPVPGDAYQILSYSNRFGTFSATNGLPVGMLVSYRANGVFLVVTTNNTPPTIIQPALAGTNFTFSFQSIAGVTYTVQVNTNLATTNWISLQVIPGDGSLKTVVEPVADAPQQFYRVSRP